MARARNIKPKFFQNEELAEVPPLGRLLFIGLWTICDFRGCLEYRPKRIRAQLLPYDDCDTEQLLNNLEKSGFIETYSVKGQRYIKIVTFERHQTPHKNERDAGSDIPDITEKDIEIKKVEEIQNNPDKNGTTPASSLFPLPDSVNLNPESPSLKAESGAVVLAPDTQPKKVDVVKEIFAYWQKCMQSPGSKLDDKRKAVIEKAMKNYTPREICEAILGCSRTPHNMGVNDTGTKYNGLKVILCDADNIERFIRASKVAPKAAKGSESIDEANARIMSEIGMGDGPTNDGMTIDMEEEEEHEGS